MRAPLGSEAASSIRGTSRRATEGATRHPVARSVQGSNYRPRTRVTGFKRKIWLTLAAIHPPFWVSKGNFAQLYPEESEDTTSASELGVRACAVGSR